MATTTGTLGTKAKKSFSLEKTRSKVNAMSNQKYGLIVVTIVVALVISCMVGIRSIEAKVQHTNNMLTQENEYLQAEIDALNGEIINETKLSNIEKIAVSDLGMVTPTSENCMIIDGEKVTNSNLASAIIEEAYN